MISDRNRAEFEQVGERGVSGRIDAGLYQGAKLNEAYEWLDEKEHGPERALAREQISIAREATEAAWAAAKAAERAADIADKASKKAHNANIIAAAAVIVSIVSIIVALLKK